MKKIILMRHAKSSWRNPGLTDLLRGLNRRGKNDAPIMGARLAARGAELDRIISSPAVRALRTAEMIMMAIGHPLDELIIDESLYLASVDEIFSVIHNLPDYLGQVMLIGHNPGMTNLVNTLCAFYLDNLPTCGIFELNYKINSWPQVGDVVPESTYFDYPKKQE